MSSNLDAVKKVLMYQKDKSGFVKEPTVKEMADLVVLVLNSVKTIEQAIESKRLDIDKKYSTPVEQSLQKIKSDNASLLTQVTRDVNALIEKGETAKNKTKEELEAQIQQAIANIRNGEDGIVTEAEIQRAAEIALGMLELPDFDALVTEAITSNGPPIRDALELLSGDERYKVEIADVQGLADALTRLSQVRTSQGGTIGKNQVYNFIREAIADGTITSGGSVSDTAYGGSWNGVTDVAPSKNAVYDKIESLVLGSGTGDVVGPASAINNNFAAFDLTTGKLIKDSGVSSASFAAALGADDNYVTDAEKAALHAAATVTDSTSIDLTITGQDITAQREALTGAITAPKNSNTTSLGSFTTAQLNTALSDNDVATGGGTASGTNTGDQTSIVGITGTKAQFDTAVTDGNFMYVGDAPTTHTHPASAITDFDTEVSNNTDVAANTAARHAAVTVTDSAEINFTLTGQDITGSLIADSVDFTKLNNINTNRILGRSTAGTGNIEELNVTAVPALIGLGTSDSPQFTGVNIGHASDTTISRVSAGVVAVEGVNLLRTSDVDDTPVNGATTDPISSNWAFDHEADTSTHGVTTVAGISEAQTLTNKRITPRVYSAANNASLTPEKDTYDIFHLTAMSANTTINNKSTTTYADGDQIRFRFLDNGTARTLTWGTDYVAKGGIALPSTTVLGKNLELGFEYNSNLAKMNLLASAQEA